MAKTSGDYEQEFMDTAKAQTGKSLQEWLDIVKGSGLEKRNDILNWLKKEQGLNHMQAQLLTGIYLNNGNPVYINENALLDAQFEKSPGMRPLFQSLSEKILAEFPDTQVIPKKTYISFTAAREFAAVNVKPAEIRLGLDLGERPFDERVQKSKLTGPMPRISHMMVLFSEADKGQELWENIRQSYNRTHKK